MRCWASEHLLLSTVTVYIALRNSTRGKLEKFGACSLPKIEGASDAARSKQAGKVVNGASSDLAIVQFKKLITGHESWPKHAARQTNFEIVRTSRITWTLVKIKIRTKSEISRTLRHTDLATSTWSAAHFPRKSIAVESHQCQFLGESTASGKNLV